MNINSHYEEYCPFPNLSQQYDVPGEAKLAPVTLMLPKDRLPTCKVMRRREVVRVADNMVRSVLPGLAALPMMYRRRLAKAFAGPFNREVKKGRHMYDARNAGIAEFNQVRKSLTLALRDWYLPESALYAPEVREMVAADLAKQVESVICTAEDANQAYHNAGLLLIDMGLTPPPAPQAAERKHSAILRMQDEEYLARKLNELSRRIREQVSICFGEVNAKTPYVSKRGFAEFQQAQARADAFLDAFVLVNEETKEEVDLRAAAEAGQANPTNRVNELTVRTDGMAKKAEDLGMVARCLTMTAPSRYHYNKGKEFNGATPRDTHAYLQECWVLCRALLAKEEIEFFGLRVVEPHKDGTPHWHMLVFAYEWQMSAIVEIMRDVYSRKDNYELTTAKARRSRFDVMVLNNPRHAARYIAKYISKNVDGARLAASQYARDLVDHETDLSIDDAADRVTAWARLHGVRQFQFFGLTPVTLWREARRLEVETANEIEAAFIEATGGKSADDVRPDWYAFEKLVETHGAVLIKEEGVGKYGDKASRTIGVAIAGKEYITHHGTWKKEHKAGSDAWVTELVEKALQSAAEESGSFRTWKDVNNCNPKLKRGEAPPTMVDF